MLLGKRLTLLSRHRTAVLQTVQSTPSGNGKEQSGYAAEGPHITVSSGPLCCRVCLP